MIAAAALLALAGPSAATCAGAPRGSANDYLADEAAHRALRAEMAVPMPTDPIHVTIYAAGGHLATTRISIVATRGPDGEWRSDAVGRSKIWVENAQASDMPRVARTLPAADGAAIDALLDDPAFWRERTAERSDAGPPPLGQMVRTIDVVTPNCARRVVAMGDEPRLLEQLDRLITPQ